MVEYASLFMATKPQSQWNISYFSTNFKVLISEEYFGQRFLALQRSYFWRLNKHSSSRKHYLGDVKETQPKQESKFYEWNTWKYGSFLQAFFFFLWGISVTKNCSCQGWNGWNFDSPTPFFSLCYPNFNKLFAWRSKKLLYVRSTLGHVIHTTQCHMLWPTTDNKNQLLPNENMKAWNCASIILKYRS